MTRIVAGTAGGRRLAVPPKGTRPTAQRVREALFSALEAADGLTGRRVLDLYAGSGALGLEALSRGAAEVVFVESDRRAVSVLRRNIADIGLPGTRVHASSVRSVVGGIADRPFDVVFVDPPYALTNDELSVVVESLMTNAWLAEDGLLVIERAKRDKTPALPNGLIIERSRDYGDTALHWCVRDLGW